MSSVMNYAKGPIYGSHTIIDNCDRVACIAIGIAEPHSTIYLTAALSGIESVIYFLVNLLDNVTLLLNDFPGWLPGTITQLVGTMLSFTPFILAPHLIISVRELDSRVVGQHIDSGFGLGSQLLSGNDIVFAGAEERIEEE
ncbi:hypothetical protein BU15DRAFT_62693 [Melanogaster broomeanus]|nr:hypothetical protein BU15DRAFT_62693 [Melanogaster broomeanus]